MLMSSSRRQPDYGKQPEQVQTPECKADGVVPPPAVRQRTILGVLIREVTRKMERMTTLAAEVKTKLMNCCRSGYVGKAGKTLQARCNQHEGGFKGGRPRASGMLNT
jgi:hypothetical protein